MLHSGPCVSASTAWVSESSAVDGEAMTGDRAPRAPSDSSTAAPAGRATARNTGAGDGDAGRESACSNVLRRFAALGAAPGREVGGCTLRDDLRTRRITA